MPSSTPLGAAGGAADDERWRRGFRLLALLHVCLWTLVAVVAQPNAPLDVLEIVAWGHEWQLGYFKHPPLPSWLAELARLAGGDGGTWPIHLLSQLAVVAGLWAVWRLALDLVRPPAALLAVALLETTTFFTLDPLDFKHSTAVLPFFASSIWFYYRALTDGRLRWWLGTGLCLGLGVLSKYIIAFLGVAMALFLIGDRRARRHLTAPGPYAALALATAVALPHLAWVVQHDYATVAYARLRAQGDGGARGHLPQLLAFFAAQVGAHALLPIAALPLLRRPWALRRLAAAERFPRRFLLAMVLGPGALFALTAALTGMHPRSAWGMPLWSGLGLLLLYCLDARPAAAAARQVLHRCALGASCFVAVALGMRFAGPHLTGEPNRVHFSGRLLAERVQRLWQERFAAPLPLVGGERWLADNVGFYARDRPSVFTGHLDRDLGAAGVSERACPWTSVEEFKRRGGVLLWQADVEGERLPEALAAHFPAAEVLPPLSLRWQTTARIQPARIGVALVAPQAN